MPYESTGNVCDWARYSDNPCEAKPTFQIETRHHDRWRICDEHIGEAVKYVAESAPLTVSPVFANWQPVGIARRPSIPTHT